MRNIIVLIGIILVGILPVRAQLFDDDQFRAQAQTGLDQMYNCSFESAGRTFYNLLEEHPEHPAPYFLLALNRWWQTYISVTMPDYYGYIDDKLNKAEDRLDLIKNKPGYDREYIFFKFMIHALEARAHSFQNEWWSAMGAAKKLVDPLEKSLYYVGQDPEFYMVAGLYHYYVETYHQQIPAIRPVLSFFPDGDIQKGLQELRTAAGTFNMAQIEAQYFLGTIYAHEIDQPANALEVTGRLHRRYTQNTWFQNDYANALIVAGRPDEARPIIENLIATYQSQHGHQTRNINSKESLHTTYLMVRVFHNLGRIHMESGGDYDAALNAFEQSNLMATLSKVEADYYLPANQYYMGLCYDYMGMREQAIAAYEDLLELDENTAYESQARSHISSPPTGN